MDPGLSHSTIPLKPLMTAESTPGYTAKSTLRHGAGWQNGTAMFQVQTVSALMFN